MANRISLILGLLLVLAAGAPARAAAAPCLNELLVRNESVLLDADGDFPDWIELYNPGPAAVNLAGYSLSDELAEPGQWQLPALSLPAGGFLLVFASGKAVDLPVPHASFRVDAGRETVCLWSPQHQLLDSLTAGIAQADVSCGRQPDGADARVYFAAPTPGAPNATPGCTSAAEAPSFSLPAGHHAGPVTVALSAPGATEIRYTLDGARVDGSSPRYEGPLLIAGTHTLRARAYAAGVLPSPLATRTYLIDEPGALLTLSLVMDPPQLWDEDFGIYVLGTDYYPHYPYYGANFWQDWERPVHVEAFDPAASRVLDQDLGIAIHGGWSRAQAQKSLRLLAGGNYGERRLEHPFFPELPFADFAAVVLRNAGNDWPYAMLRDPLAREFARDTGLAAAAYRPAVVLLNGEYWGIHNVRERLDEHYLAANWAADPDNVDLLEGRQEVVHGEAAHYLDLLAFVEQHPLSEAAHYEHLKTLMDVEDFADYMVHEIYLGNTDWPGKNIRYWRPRTAAGRWRWILHDLDFTMGRGVGPEHDTLQFATESDPGAVEAANPLWSTFLLRSLLENESFRHLFINRFAERMSAGLRPAAMHAVLDRLSATIEPEMPRHRARWGQSLAGWYAALATLRAYIDARPDHMLAQLRAKFGLGDTLGLTVRVEPARAGRVQLGCLAVDSLHTAACFRGIPISLRAEPAPGYAFQGWAPAGFPADSVLTLTPAADLELTARFAPTATAAGSVVINEINCRPGPGHDPEDWVELHNPGSAALDLTGWTLRDAHDEHGFVLPAGAVLAGGGYLVLCRSLADFCAQHPQVQGALGDFDFGLSGGGDMLRLFDRAGGLADWVSFDDAAPWPPPPTDRHGTLELICPAQDNAWAAAWSMSLDEGGSPAAPNSVYRPVELLACAGLPGPGELRLSWEYRLHGSPPEFRVKRRLGGETALLVPSAAGVGRAALHDRDAALLEGGTAVYTLEARKPGEPFRPLALMAFVLEAVPFAGRLEWPFPNPFNPSCEIAFTLSHAGRASLSIHDVQGRLVARLLDGPVARGPQALRWDGTDRDGRPAASGLYLAVLQAGQFRQSRKLILLR